jgi:hypothetical protein
MDILDRLDSLRMLEDIIKETQKHDKKLQRLINHPVKITLFRDSHPTITLIQEQPRYEKGQNYHQSKSTEK